jgi:hypothetical protein
MPAQGRLGGDFDDQNEGLISALCKAHPSLVSLEMETFHLLDLARCARGGGKWEERGGACRCTGSRGPRWGAGRPQCPDVFGACLEVVEPCRCKERSQRALRIVEGAQGTGLPSLELKARHPSVT